MGQKHFIWVSLNVALWPFWTFSPSPFVGVSSAHPTRCEHSPCFYPTHDSASPWFYRLSEYPLCGYFKLLSSFLTALLSSNPIPPILCSILIRNSCSAFKLSMLFSQTPNSHPYPCSSSRFSLPVNITSIGPSHPSQSTSYMGYYKNPSFKDLNISILPCIHHVLPEGSLYKT